MVPAVDQVPVAGVDACRAYVPIPVDIILCSTIFAIAFISESV